MEIGKLKTLKSNSLILLPTVGQPDRHIHIARERQLNYGETLIKTFLSISSYAVVSLASSIMVIGGSCDGNESSQVAKYTASSNAWTNAGSLIVARNGHRAVLNGNRIHVIGGNMIK